MGLCPFHDERSPSFSVDPQEKLYHCFGCGEAGTCFGLVMEKEGLQFAEAVEALADRYGVELQREQEDLAGGGAPPGPPAPPTAAGARVGLLLNYPGSPKRRAKRASTLPGAARRADAAGLRASASRPAPGTDPRRRAAGGLHGTGDGTASASCSGARRAASTTASAPASCSRSVTPAAASSASVAGPTRSDQKPKYVNTAETDFFHKSEILYGLDRPVRRWRKRTGRWWWRATPTSSPCTRRASRARSGVMGTAITPDQVKTLSGVVDEVILRAGRRRSRQEAMLRAQRVAGGGGCACASPRCRRGRPGRADGRARRRRALPAPTPRTLPS